MTAPSHQTVRLKRGKHRSPAEGVCVMELASMLAGEPFTDHPSSVCPVIGAFLRAYNDVLEDDRRQVLYAYAAKVVGTRRGRREERSRARIAAETLLDRGERPPSPRMALPRRRRERIADAAGRALGRSRREGDHLAALALLDRLIEPPDAPDAPSPAPAEGRVSRGVGARSG